VEHPVTELVTGLDLVEWQVRIASGERLTVRQEDVAWRGWAMECRVYAEDPEHGFLPFPGKIEQLSEPSGPGVRLDSGVYPGWTVPLDYDPLLAKLAVWGADRERALERLDRALAEYVITGIRTNVAFFRERQAEMYAGYHKAVAPLNDFVSLGELAAGRTADGSLVFCAPLDHLVWTESIGRFITAANKVIDETGPKKKQLWVTGIEFPSPKGIRKSRLASPGR